MKKIEMKVYQNCNGEDYLSYLAPMDECNSNDPECFYKALVICDYSHNLSQLSFNKGKI